MNLIDKLKNNYELLIGFACLGLINNFLYVVILSAAPELITGYTGIVLLVLIVPNIIFKFFFPFIASFSKITENEYVRITVYTLIYLSSFHFILWFPHTVGVRILGLGLASLSSSMGELFFLQLASTRTPYAGYGWCIGTGIAGVLGASLYLGLSEYTSLNYSSILLILCPTPSLAVAAYLAMLDSKKTIDDIVQQPTTTLQKKWTWFKEISIPYLLPLFTTFLIVYLVNQGFVPNLYYSASFDESRTYKYLQLFYQIGVFISRSSLIIINLTLRQTYSLIIGTIIIFVLMLCEFLKHYMHYVEIPMTIMLIQGLLSGAVYGNILNSLTQSISTPLDKNQFCSGILTFASDVGIAIAALIAFGIEQT